MRGELETEQRLQHIDPQLFWLSQPFCPVLLGCSTGGLGTQPLLGHGSHSTIFSSTDLNFPSPGLYNNLTSTYFLRASQFALNSTRRHSRSPPDIFYRMHMLFTPVHFFFWQLGRGQYATLGDRLYLKISENLMHFILQEGFWFVHIPFYSMIKFQFLIQFPVDHLPCPFVSSLILSLHEFATFAYYVINRFLSIIT